MLLPKFAYLAPGTLEEATALLSRHGAGARVIAGGTDLLVKMKDRVLSPDYLIGLRNLSNLDKIEYDDKDIRIGAMATLNSVAGSAVLQKELGLLAHAAEVIATNQIRNMGTIGGNLCNAAPSADTAPPLIAGDASVSLVSPAGTRTVALEELFCGPGETVLKADEILTEIRVPPKPRYWSGAYMKFSSRSARDIAAVGVAVALTLEGTGKCRDCKIVLGAVAPTPMRSGKAEQVIKGEKISDALALETGRLAAAEARPISDVRSSADYRREIVSVLTRRALAQALAQVESNER